MENWLMINAIIVFTIAFALSSISVPLVIKLAIKKRLLGEYGEGRHVHKGYVPSGHLYWYLSINIFYNFARVRVIFLSLFTAYFFHQHCFFYA